MRMTVWIKPQARSEKVEKVSDLELRVWVKAPAREGKANGALMGLLADYFGRPKSAIQAIGP